MKDRKIPTILGTVLLLAILFAGVFVTLRTTNTQSRASGECLPIGVQVTNLTNRSVDISFLTTAACSSSLSINNKINQNFKDSSTTHYYRIDNLQPNTEYSYYIIAGGKEFRELSYSLKTAPQNSTSLPTATLAWGKILNSPNTIVYLNIPGAWPLSALTDINGQWHISLSNSFADDRSGPFTPPSSGTEDILVYPPDGNLTQVENSLTRNDPVPDITIGVGFDDGLGTGPGSTIVPTKTIAPTTTVSTKLSITSPIEGDSITALKPDIFGKGKGNSTISIKIDSSITGSTVTRTDGSWNWSPLNNLSLGKHVLTVTLGSETITRNFSLVSPANSTSPLSFSATPSATIAPTASPTSLPSPVPTIRTGKVSTKSGMPITGGADPLYFLILSSLLTVSFSLYFFYYHEK